MRNPLHMVTLNFDKNISKNSARSKIKNQPIYRMKHRNRDEKTVVAMDNTNSYIRFNEFVLQYIRVYIAIILPLTTVYINVFTCFRVCKSHDLGKYPFSQLMEA